jgi:hypothetical protein
MPSSVQRHRRQRSHNPVDSNDPLPEVTHGRMPRIQKMRIFVGTIRADHIVISLFACNRAADHTFRIADLHVSLLSRGRTLFLARYGGARKTHSLDSSSACMPRGDGPCLRRTGHPFAVSGLGRPSQMIEYVFAASPETTRREASGDSLSFAQSANGGTWQPAHWGILCLFRRRRVTPRCFVVQPAQTPAAHDQRRADRPPSCAPPPEWHDSHALSLFPFHR